MDSLTQIVLGAAVGEILLGRTLGNKALLLGAIGGTVPDLDVIYSLFNNDPVKQLEVHRGYSHSVFTHFLLALPFAWISKHWNTKDISLKKWYWFWFLCFFTHTLLDCCTTYGTKLFTPFSNYQVAFNNISVIDPLYTLPFLILLAGCMFFERTSIIRRKFLIASLLVSSAYMLLTFGIKYKVHKRFEASLKNNKIQVTELNTTPTILNAVLWSAIAYNDSVLYVGEYSYLNQKIPIHWIPYKRNLSELSNFKSKPVEVLEWFSDGNYFVKPVSKDTILFYSVKFGRMNFDSIEPESAFLFCFKLTKANDEVKYTEIRPDNLELLSTFNNLMTRIGI